MKKLPSDLVLFILAALVWFAVAAMTGNKVDDAETYRINHSEWPKSE